MTRIQKEHDNAADAASFAAIDFDRYKLSRELVRRMKTYAPILHPFPRDQHFGEIPPEIDDDPRAMRPAAPTSTPCWPSTPAKRSAT